MLNTLLLFAMSYAFIIEPLTILFIILMLIYGLIRAQKETKVNIIEEARKHKEEAEKERKINEEFIKKHDQIIKEILKEK